MILFTKEEAFVTIVIAYLKYSRALLGYRGRNFQIVADFHMRRRWMEITARRCQTRRYCSSLCPMGRESRACRAQYMVYPPPSRCRIMSHNYAPNGAILEKFPTFA